MTRSRSKRLTANVEHERDDAPPDKPWPYHCARCHKPYRSDGRGGWKPPFGYCDSLKRSGLDRGSGPKPVSETNSGRAHQRDEGLREYVRRLPCVVCGSPPPNSACHVKNWGAGYGDWVTTPDGERVGNLYPGCVEHHREEENALNSGPETFEAEHDIDLAAEARTVGRSYLSS